MSFLDEIDADFANEIEADFGKVFTWSGSDYACAPTGFERQTVIELGGNPVQIRAELIVRRSIFPNSTPPTSGDLITYDNVSYKVAVAENIYGKLARLVLVDPQS